MVDIHCHILPGVDDGARTLEESLEMARISAESGVEMIIATPHCNIPCSYQPNYLSEELLEYFAAFREQLRQEQIPVALGLGSEVYCTSQLRRLLEQRMLLPLAGSRYLLVEFPFHGPLYMMDDLLAQVAAEGLVPVIAHPERYEALQQEPFAAERWFQQGYVIQLNKGSILGDMGRSARDTAYWLLDNGLAHVVASDAHDTRGRTPDMQRLREMLEQGVGRDYARILLKKNPMRIVKDLPVAEA